MAASFLPPENVRFVFGPTPLLLLAEAPIHQDLPVLHVADGRMPVCDEWQLMAGLTMCVVDGPGESGCLIPTLGPDTDADKLAEWCSSCVDSGGAVVVSLDSIPDQIDWEEVFTSGAARGGFVRGGSLEGAFSGPVPG